MDKSSILEFNNKESVSDVLNELLRDGAQQLIHQAVEAELSEYLSQRHTGYGNTPKRHESTRMKNALKVYLDTEGLMVAAGSILVDAGRDQSVGQAAADEAVVDADVMVQIPPRIGKVRGAIAAVAHDQPAIDESVTEADLAIFPGRRADHLLVLRCIRLGVEVAHEDGVERIGRWILAARPVDATAAETGASPHSALGLVAAVACEELPHLDQALHTRQCSEVDRVEPNRDRWKLDDTFDRAHPHVEVIDGVEFREDVQPRADDWPQRQQHASMLPSAVNHLVVARSLARIHVEIWAVDPVIIGQQGAQFGRLIDRHAVARPEALDLVQADHIGATDSLGDPPEVEPIVSAPGILDIVSHDLHCRVIPSFTTHLPLQQERGSGETRDA